MPNPLTTPLSPSRRLPHRPDLHRRRHPQRHQAHEPHQLRQARQDGRGDPRHPAVPEHAVLAAARSRVAGVHPQRGAEDER